jgi:hypothetical protein
MTSGCIQVLPRHKRLLIIKHIFYLFIIRLKLTSCLVVTCKVISNQFWLLALSISQPLGHHHIIHQQMMILVANIF